MTFTILSRGYFHDVENVLSMDILTVLMKSKTNIDSLLYSACIQKVIPGLLTSNDLGNHFAAVLSLVQRSNFPEILLILTKRIPYLEKEARTKFLKGYESITQQKPINEVLFRATNKTKLASI